MSVLLDTDSSMMITIERKKEQLPWSTLSWIWSGIRRFTFSEMVKDPVFLTGEIIQIGAIKLNQTLEVVDSFNERIAPQYYTELHPKVAEITKLSNRDLQKGKGFHTVFNSFCDWCGDDFVFLVWGTEDLRILRKNMDLHNIDTTLCPRVSIYRTSLWIKLHTIQSNTHWPMHWRSSARLHLIPTMP